MTRQILLTMLAFGLYGLSKLAYNYFALRFGGAALVGDVNALLAVQTVLLVFIAQPVASTVSRFLPEHLTEQNRRLAAGLMLRGMLLTCTLSFLLFALLVAFQAPLQRSLGLAHPELYRLLLPYIFGYSAYFYFKMVYYGYKEIGSYCFAELVASVAFFAALAFAGLDRRPGALVLPWILQPLVFCLIAVLHFRRERPHVMGPAEAPYPVRRYLEYSVNWLASAASGLGAYHLSILLTAVLIVDPPTVGYYSIVLSMLTPLNFLPITVSMVLFPHMTSNFAAGNDQSNAGLVRKATGGLLLSLSPAVICIFVLAPEVLGFFGVPPQPQLILTVQLVALGILVSLISTPAASFLSATLYARSAAAIGVSTLVLGLALWLILIPRIGVVGSAIGYAALMGAKGAANIFASHHHRPWLKGSSLRLASVGLVLLGSAAAGHATGLFTKGVALFVALSLCGWLLLPEVRTLRSAVSFSVRPSLSRS